MSVYAVSDLHGQYNLWKQVIEYIGKDDILYILGDCTDRGQDGWRILKEALSDSRVRYIRGNHDQMILQCWRDGWTDPYAWFYNSGYDTYCSILDDSEHEIYLMELARKPIYEEFINKQGQKIFLSHAGFTLMENGMPDKEDLFWDRSHIDDACDWWPEQEPNTYVIHGHTPVGSSTFIRNYNAFPDRYSPNEEQTIMRYAHGHKICIDAGCFFNHKISMLNLDTLQEERMFIDNVEK